jgi:uracil-DNA glycosylase
MEIKISNSWQEILQEEFKKDYFIKLSEFIDNEYNTQTIYPPQKNIFSAFDYCDFNDLKVVILGQDPYHGYGQAHGLCFSVNKGIKIPPSLRNIFKELINEYNEYLPWSGNLTHWAKQGVLMINATLTVREKQANSHQGKGWETFTDNVIKLISDKKENVVFVLWGTYAQKKEKLINKSKHQILQSAHPSPLSAHRGFLGNNHFRLINEYLVAKNKKEITW